MFTVHFVLLLSGLKAGFFNLREGWLILRHCLPEQMLLVSGGGITVSGKKSDGVHFKPADSGSLQTNALQLKVRSGSKKEA